MPHPDASMYAASPEYLRELLDRAGMTQDQAAKRIGVSPRQMRRYVSLDSKVYSAAPYPVQFALECLPPKAKGGRR